MPINEGRVRRIIREEIQLEMNRRAVAASAAWAARAQREHARPALNEGWQGGDIELGSINGRVVARMLRDSGETLLASLIMNYDRPGASEYVWDQVLRRGKDRSRSWSVEFPLERIVYRGMSLHDMGFRNGEITVVVGQTLGDPPFHDFNERISREVKISVNFAADDRYGKRIALGELRQGGLRSSGRSSVPHRGIDEIQHAYFSLRDVSLDYLDHLIARREAAAYI